MVERIADHLTAAWIWDPREQEYRPYSPSDPLYDPWAFEIHTGQALLVNVDESVRWGPPRGPAVTSADWMSAESRAVLTSTVRTIHTHFTDWLDFSPATFEVNVKRFDRGCLSDGGDDLLVLYLPCEDLHRLAGAEMAKRYAAQFAHGSDRRPAGEPGWLTTGLGHYAAHRYIADTGIRDPDAMKSELVGIARSTSLALDADELAVYFVPAAGALWYGTKALLHESLSTLAVIWLAERHGDAALRAYARKGRGDSWPDAFVDAFGQTPEQMLAAFAEYRADIAGPAPIRLSQPFHQVAFIGEITDERREMAAEIERIVDSFEQRYGSVAKTATFVLDLDLDTYNSARGTNWNGYAEECGREQISIAYIRDVCSDPTTTAHEYFHILQNEQETAGAYPRRPLWLREGSADYAALQHSTVGFLPFASLPQTTTDRAQVLAGLAQKAALVVAALEAGQPVADLAREALQAAPYTVGQFAVRRLAEQFGDRSILEAFGPKWTDAGRSDAEGFEAVFNLPLEQFLADFGTWLRGLIKPD